MNYDQTCGSVGPWVKISPTFQKQLSCNRVAGHGDDGLGHRYYDPTSFAVIAQWDVSATPDERKRKKITR